MRSAGLWLLRVRRVCRLLCEGAECVDPVWMWAVCGDGFVRARWRRRSSEVRGWWLVRVPVPLRTPHGEKDINKRATLKALLSPRQ